MTTPKRWFWTLSFFFLVFSIDRMLTRHREEEDREEDRRNALRVTAPHNNTKTIIVVHKNNGQNFARLFPTQIPRRGPQRRDGERAAGIPESDARRPDVRFETGFGFDDESQERSRDHGRRERRSSRGEERRRTRRRTKDATEKEKRGTGQERQREREKGAGFVTRIFDTSDFLLSGNS